MLYKRGRVWWIKLSVAGQKPVRESARTTDRQAAQEYHDTRAAQLWREHQLGERPRVTFSSAAADWVTTHASRKKSFDDDRLRLAQMLPMIPECGIEEITTAFMTRLRDRLLLERQVRAGRGAEGEQLYRPITQSSVNKYLAILSAILHHAHKREWLEAVPHVPMFPPGPKRRLPMLSAGDVSKILAELPPHLLTMARFALATGQRQSNVRLLRWENVDLTRRVAIVWADEAKAGEEIAIPLGDEAVEILRAQMGAHPEFVFTYPQPKPNGLVVHRPIAGKLTNTAWLKARKRAGFPTLRWHDFRHIWATWHAASGTPAQILQAMGGWSDRRMVDRYTHLAAQHLLGHANAFVIPKAQPRAHGTVEREEVLTGKASAGNGVGDGIRTHDNRNHKPRVYHLRPEESTTCVEPRRPRTAQNKG